MICEKKTFFLLCLCASVALLFAACQQTNNQKSALISSIHFVDSSASVDTITVIKKDKSIFRLNYTSVGMGSNFMSMQPVFDVTGTEFIYTSEQTSFYEGTEIQKPDTICTGKIRPSSIDSILHLVRGIKDSLVYRTNIGIMSGGLHSIHVSKDNIDIEFRLHNASDAIAQKIVAILNTYIPSSEKKLWLFNIPDNSPER